jgi:DNA-binding NarL/FixJ family response regulator/c-di-GMP-binding flagellar brake protein YcgR
MTPQPAASVLIADADPYICRVFEAKLTKENPFRVTSVTTGPEALAAVIQTDFTAVLWDMRLRDTPRLLARIRALSPNAALLLLTTDDRPTLDTDLARLDISDVLVKPLNLDTLVERINAAIEAPPSISQSSVMDVSRVGQRLEISSAHGTCVTRVMENRHDSFTVVGAPRVNVPDDFRTGLLVRAQIAGHDAVYSFTSRVVRSVSDPVEGWEIQKPRTIRREQRRKFPRLPLSYAILLEQVNQGRETGSELPTEAAVAQQAAGPVDGQTEDVGIGGCALVADFALPAGTPVNFVLTPHAEEPITGTGTIVRSVPFSLTGDASSDAVYRLAVQFLSLPPSSRRQLQEVLDLSS